MLFLLKHLVAGKELAELDRWRTTWDKYRGWLAEIPMITVTLDNLKNEVSGTESMDACHPPFRRGPWTVDNLRYHLRNLVLDVSTLRKIDGVWSFEPERRSTETNRANKRIEELEALFKSANNVIAERNKEIGALRKICGEAHVALSNIEDVNVKRGLENLRAASNGEVVPFSTFIVSRD